MKQHFNKACTNDVIQNKSGASKLIAVYLKTALEALANYLQLRTERLPKRKQKILLFLFSLLFGGGSIAIICYSFAITSIPPSTPKITFPKYSLVHAPKPRMRDSLISHREYARINQFRHYLEHLQMDAPGKRIYDSLVQARPYLLDSLRQVDSIYFNQ